MDFCKEFDCACGKKHKSSVDKVIVNSGAINQIVDLVKQLKKSYVYLLSDKNTFNVAGNKVKELLLNSNIQCLSYVFNIDHLEPNESSVGSAFMHFDKNCDIVIGVGSGVINDIGKIVSNFTNLPYIIVATAPSMDGYASATSSMARDGLKVSIQSRCPNIIVGDLEVLKNAPKRMLLSGLGDMLAKYVSICEWRISNLINGEYYCEKIADIIRNAVKKCVDNATNMINGDEQGVQAVFEGLILGGVAMEYALCSRPASGVEHYFSHIWDMRGLELGKNVDFHGIQCGVATVYAIKIYEQIINIVPNREKALLYVKKFNYEKHKIFLRSFLGNSAEPMIELEEKEQKYNIENHQKRLEKIIDNWDNIVAIIKEELVPLNKLIDFMQKLQMPTTIEEIGISESQLENSFIATKDIRDKYVLSRLCWDLGIIEDINF